MVETILGIWLFLLTFGAGFWVGQRRQGKRKSERTTAAEGRLGWQELLNFLQYDGSGTVTANNKEIGGKSDEEQYYSGANSARVRTRRSI